MPEQYNGIPREEKTMQTKIETINPKTKETETETEVIEYKELEQVLFESYKKIQKSLDEEIALANEFAKTGKPTHNKTLIKIAQLQEIYNEITQIYTEDIDANFKEAQDTAREGAEFYVAKPKRLESLLHNVKKLSEEEIELTIEDLYENFSEESLLNEEQRLQEKADSIREQMLKTKQDYVRFSQYFKTEGAITKSKWEETEEVWEKLAAEMKIVRGQIQDVRKILKERNIEKLAA